MTLTIQSHIYWLPMAGLAMMLGACSGYKSQVEAPDFDIEVVATDIRLVDGLAWYYSGAILATEEYRGGGLARIDPVSGAFTYLTRGLADPDNIVVIDRDIYLTEEDEQGRIVHFDSLLERHVLADGLDGPEGLDLGPDGRLYVAEHFQNGRVYSYSLDGTRQTVGRVTNGEGLRVLPDGTVVVAETTKDRLVAFSPDGQWRVVATEMKSPDGVAYDPVNDRVLVTEDRAPGRLLAVDVPTGDVDTLATGLNAPQTMLVEEDGSILLAEQSENRILRLRPKEAP